MFGPSMGEYCRGVSQDAYSAEFRRGIADEAHYRTTDESGRSRLLADAGIDGEFDCDLLYAELTVSDRGDFRGLHSLGAFSDRER